MVVNDLDCVGVLVQATAGDSFSLLVSNRNESILRHFDPYRIGIEQRALQIGGRIGQTRIAQVESNPRSLAIHAVAVKTFTLILEKRLTLRRIAQLNRVWTRNPHRPIYETRPVSSAVVAVRGHRRPGNTVLNDHH